MKILILDGQGGKLGSQLVKTILARFPQADLTAVGTNAAATSAMSRLGCRRRYMFTGTGLAQPKPTVNIRARPSQSMWCSGFRLSRCSRFAVGSPSA